MASPGGGGGKGGGLEGFHIRWDPHYSGHPFQISQADSHSDGRQLASGGQQPAKGKAEVVATGKGARNR